METFTVQNGITSSNPINQNILNIGDVDKHLSATVVSSTTIQNQTINISSGSLTMNNAENDGSIEHSYMTITEHGKLKANASNLIDIVNGVQNSGIVEFTDGTNDNVISGTGELIINGDVSNNTGRSISQNKITVNEEKSFTANATDITTDENFGIVNAGTVTFNAGTNTNKISGDGNLIIVGQVTNSTGKINQSSITVTEDDITVNLDGIQQNVINFYGDNKTLTLDGSDPDSADAIATITATGSINNYVSGDSLHLINTRLETPAFTNNEEDKTVFGNGSLVSGAIYNNGGTIEIISNNFVVENGITSNNQAVDENILNIGNTENAAVVNSSTTISYQTITVSSGSLTMKSDGTNGTISNSSITVATDGLLSINPENLVNISNPITNNGIVDFYGVEAVNVSTITGSGELIIDGDIINQEGTKITQNKIRVIDSNNFRVNANDVDTTAGTGILNDGSLYFVGG